MRPRGNKARRLLLPYVFAVFVGALAGPIVRAGLLYSEWGWAATWVEINNWGRSLDQREFISERTDRG